MEVVCAHVLLGLDWGGNFFLAVGFVGGDLGLLAFKLWFGGLFIDNGKLLAVELTDLLDHRRVGLANLCLWDAGCELDGLWLGQCGGLLNLIFGFHGYLRGGRLNDVRDRWFGSDFFNRGLLRNNWQVLPLLRILEELHHGDLVHRPGAVLVLGPEEVVELVRCVSDPARVDHVELLLDVVLGRSVVELSGAGLVKLHEQTVDVGHDKVVEGELHGCQSDWLGRLRGWFGRLAGRLVVLMGLCLIN